MKGKLGVISNSSTNRSTDCNLW